MNTSARFHTPSIKHLAAAALVLAGSAFVMHGACAATLSSFDQQFLNKAADAGNTEVAASKLADSKSTNADVKNFAAEMVKDHTAVGNELKQLAASKGVTVSDQPSDKQQKKIDDLGTLSGAKFDKKYAARIGVSAHEDTVSLFKKAARKADDAQVKAFAEKTLPGLEHHLSMAKTLKVLTSKE